jgi:hypothetical protein
VTSVTSWAAAGGDFGNVEYMHEVASDDDQMMTMSIQVCRQALLL